MRKKPRQRKWYVLLSIFAIIVMLFIFASMYAEQRLEAARERLKQPENVREFEALVAAAQAEEPPPSILREKVAEARSRMELFAKLRSEILARRARSAEWAAIEKDFLGGWDEWTPERWSEVEALFEENQDLLEQIRRLARQEGPLHPIDLSQGFNLDLHHHADLRSFARLLGVDAKLQARKGNWNVVIEDIAAQLNLSKGAAQEPLLMPQLIANSLSMTAYRTVEDAVPPGALNADQVGALSALFDDAFDRERYAAALSTEANMAASSISEQGGWLASSGLVRWYLDINSATHLELTTPIIEASTRPYYESAATIENHREAVESLPFYKPFPRALSGHSESLLAGPARVEAEVELLQTGLRIEAYHAAHGTYPESLEEIGAAAIDPFSGERLRYVSNENGFMLYSVGEDLEDDGGQHDRQEGDIVWRGED